MVAGGKKRFSYARLQLFQLTHLFFYSGFNTVAPKILLFNLEHSAKHRMGLEINVNDADQTSFQLNTESLSDVYPSGKRIGSEPSTFLENEESSFLLANQTKSFLMWIYYVSTEYLIKPQVGLVSILSRKTRRSLSSLHWVKIQRSFFCSKAIEVKRKCPEKTILLSYTWDISFYHDVHESIEQMIQRCSSDINVKSWSTNL